MQFMPVLGVKTTLFGCDQCNELQTENKALREQLQIKNKAIQNLHDVIGMYENQLEKKENRK